MLGIPTIPDDILATDPYKSSRLFLDVSARAGLTPFRVPLPIDWPFVRGELDGQYEPTYTTSDIGLGVNNGGKQSIDVTYLTAAEVTGQGGSSKPDPSPVHARRNRKENHCPRCMQTWPS